MDIRTKNMLLERLQQTNSEAILDQIRAILMGDGKDFWEDLDAESQDSINKGKTESRQGETRSHEEVMKQMKKRFLK